MNADANARIAPTLAAWDDAANVRRAFPTGALVGSFGYEGGFFLSERSDELHVLVNLFAQFAADAGEATIDSVTVVEDFTACGADVFAPAVDPAQAARDGDTVTLSGGGVDASGVVIEERVSDGATWWCVR